MVYPHQILCELSGMTHPFCDRLRKASIDCRNQFEELSEPIDHLSQLALQANKDKFADWLETYLPKTVFASVQQGRYDLVYETFVDQLEWMNDVRRRLAYYCMHACSRAPHLCQGFSLGTFGVQCLEHPCDGINYCQTHRDEAEKCVYIRNDSEGMLAFSDRFCATECETDVDGNIDPARPFCRYHNDHIVEVCEALEESAEVQDEMDDVLGVMQDFFEAQPLTIRVKKHEIKEELCSICYEELSQPQDTEVSDSEIAKAKRSQVHGLRMCSHQFHACCILDCIATSNDCMEFVNNKCPMCRTPIWDKGQICEKPDEMLMVNAAAAAAALIERSETNPTELHEADHCPLAAGEVSTAGSVGTAPPNTPMGQNVTEAQATAGAQENEHSELAGLNWFHMGLLETLQEQMDVESDSNSSIDDGSDADMDRGPGFWHLNSIG